MTVDVIPLRGREIEPYIPSLAELRIVVFREFPYLYEGDAAYETRYLSHYAEHPDSLCVIAKDGERVVGAATGLWLQDADADFQSCFRDTPWAEQRFFYFGESVLLAEYRGQGLGHRFFDEREAHARAVGAEVTGFCAVERAADHPARPGDYRDLHAFWRKRGYRHYPELKVGFNWKEIGQSESSQQTMSFWLRSLVD